MILLLIIIMLIGVYCLYMLSRREGKFGKNDSLITDMEINIAQLEIKPSNNRNIKKISSYLESVIMPNEKILGVAYSHIFTVITDKRVIIKGETSNYINIVPIEKISSVTQEGARIFINQNWVNLLSVDLASKVTNLINNQISSFQTVNQAIKIENKIVTEETITSQLKKLSDLHDANVLTDYEYSIKKQELLDKLN